MLRANQPLRWTPQRNWRLLRAKPGRTRLDTRRLTASLRRKNRFLKLHESDRRYARNLVCYDNKQSKEKFSNIFILLSEVSGHPGKSFVSKVDKGLPNE